MSDMELEYTAEKQAPFRVDPTGILRFQNGAGCGAIVQEVDGFYVWYPRENGGFWESAYLRKIADLLDDMNAPWQEQIDNDPAVTRPIPSVEGESDQ